jgi:hypothetical protein
VIRKEDAAVEEGRRTLGVLIGLGVVGLFENQIMKLRYGTEQELTGGQFGRVLWQSRP